ncbi:MAG: hypothetical protein N5P05_003944 [Chroococcopsis gigantea SAG 12.99]|jgi:predicted DCC family thiol-disulfide oxidoreductase YuxK|nr:DUF393 domain-containing protein [Chlorogloea purpurea SAG 13.99]MDV3002338.1 hypothetical protein [Chroococcopsis gigantea SAG 12.99]
MTYYVIYDSCCNLCAGFTNLLKTFDRDKLFQYIPMQDERTLSQFNVTPANCEMGMMLIDGSNPDKRWQGSEAGEEIIRLLPLGSAFILAYRALPGAKWLGDRTYEQIRDNRYQWFGVREPDN